MEYLPSHKRLLRNTKIKNEITKKGWESPQRSRGERGKGLTGAGKRNLGE